MDAFRFNGGKFPSRDTNLSNGHRGSSKCRITFLRILLDNKEISQLFEVYYLVVALMTAPEVIGFRVEKLRRIGRLSIRSFNCV